MAVPPWRLRLLPASFRGAPFKTNVDEKSSGRRIALHEFPKKDIPYAEDMGRRARRFTLSAYIISGPNTPDYAFERDLLVAALEVEGPGWLVRPTAEGAFVVVDQYSVKESKDRGGIAEFEIAFTEFGADISSMTGILLGTQGLVQITAQASIAGFQVSVGVDLKVGL